MNIMRRGVLILLVLIITAILLTSCAGSSANVPASGDVQSVDIGAGTNTEAGSGADVAEGSSTKPGIVEDITGNGTLIDMQQELYPAYLMEGHVKKWGYINGDGVFVIAPEYDDAGDFLENGTANVFKSGLWGLIDKSGRTIIEPQYLSLFSSSGNKRIAFDNMGNSILLDGQGRELFRTEGNIEEASCGLSAFSKKTDNGDFLWGYINEEGKVVIEPIYLWAHSFVDDKAIVENSPGHHGVIDKTGKLIGDLGTDTVVGMSDDTVLFLQNTGGYTTRYGYKTLDGKILLKAVYSDAQRFEDGLAIVNASQEYTNMFGVINKKGEFVIPPKYSMITYLGGGIFAVPETVDFYYGEHFLPKALFDKNGTQLTDFKFYDLERLENGLISVTDDRSTYLVDDKGNEAGKIPKTTGIGSIRACGELYRVNADEYVYYISQEGKRIWASDNTIKLDGGLEIKHKTFRPDRYMLIFYPELAGIADLTVQKGINTLLRDEFLMDREASHKEDDLYVETTDVSFSSERNKDLLIVTKHGYYYPIGAAHGQPSMKDYHINLRTGKLYSLSDLFKKDVNYEDKLAEIVRGKMAEMVDESGESMLYDDIERIDSSNYFIVKKDALVIYFQPYEIAAYAVGFPEFSIGYDLLDGLIDTEGEFWKAFERCKAE
jgi:hypothetical protein